MKITSEDKWMLDVQCCICDKSCKDSEHINHYETRYIPTWEAPVTGNLIIPNYGKRASAQVCDECINNKTSGPIQYVVEYKDKEVTRHSVEGLERIPYPILLKYEFHAEPGNPWCLCSACHELIPEGQAPIVIFTEDGLWNSIFCEKHTMRNINDVIMERWMTVGIEAIGMNKFLSEKEKNLTEAERRYHQEIIKARMGGSAAHMGH